MTQTTTNTACFTRNVCISKQQVRNLWNKTESLKPWITQMLWRCRSSHQSCSMKKGVLRNFAKFTGNHLCQSLFFNKVAGLRPTTLSKKRLWHRCFPVSLTKFLRTPFLQSTSGQLFLEMTSK